MASIPLYAPAADTERFWSKVDRRGVDDCWLWLGQSIRKGYGCTIFCGRKTGAHRVSWALANGHWPRLFILHRCDTPLCVNPAHLWEGDQYENVRDMMAKGRWNNQFRATPKTHCIRGHEFTPENTCHSGGRRYCRACWKVRDARRCADRKQARLLQQEKSA